MTAAHPPVTAIHRSLPLLAGLGLLVLCVVLNWRDPVYPALGLDPSWKLAVEHAARQQLVFGRDVVFTYGPYQAVATRLFDPATYPMVLAYDALTVVAAFWAALRNRSWTALIVLAATFVLFQPGYEAQFGLLFFGVFLTCLTRDRVMPYVFIVLCAPLLLVKLTFGLMLAPLLVLADAERLSRRAPPVLTALFVAAGLVAYVAAGQPMASLGDYLANNAEVVLGYGRAMQAPGPYAELGLTLVLLAAAAGLLAACAFLAWRRERGDLRPAIVLAGFGWILFVLFKVGFVRQDGHTLFLHWAAPGLTAMAYGALRTSELGRAARGAVTLLIVALTASAIYWTSYIIRPDNTINPVATAARPLQALWPRLQAGIGWATGRSFAQARQARDVALQQARRTFPPAVAGTVDAIPFELTPLIASGLDYRPRPVIQSYSSYTPKLQQMDAAHFAGPRAPDTLFLRLQDVDNRLPSLSLGPSLLAIGQHYDPVGVDELGLILRRRGTPRPLRAQRTEPKSFEMRTWIETPVAQRVEASGRLIMAHVELKPSLLGRMVGLLYREPVVAITLHTASGRDITQRFIPGMAQAGFAVSPLPMSGTMSATMLLDERWMRFGDPVSAILLQTSGKDWMFDGGTVWFEEVSFAPGFADGLGESSRLAAELAGSGPPELTQFDGREIFAHAPNSLTTRVLSTVRLRGVAGLRPQPAGTPPGDGVGFVIRVVDRTGAAKVLFERTVRPGEPPTPFDVTVPAGSTLQLETLKIGDTRFDWSYWGGLEAAQ